MLLFTMHWPLLTEQGNSEPAGRKEQHVYVWVSIPVQVRRRIHSFISAQMQAQCKAILIKAIRKPPDGCLIKKEPIGAAVRSTGVMQQVFTLPDIKPLSCESGKRMKRHPIIKQTTAFKNKRERSSLTPVEMSLFIDQGPMSQGEGEVW